MILTVAPKDYKTGDAVTAKVINDTIDTAIEANKKADIAISELDGATAALAEAKAIEARANNGEFNGKDAVLITAGGTFGFQVENGELVLYCEDNSVAPNAVINENGELVLTIN